MPALPSGCHENKKSRQIIGFTVKEACERREKLKVLLLTQVFYPDEVAGAQYITDLAEDMIARGHEVDVITANYQYENPKNIYKSAEVYNEISINRIWSTRFTKKRFVARIFNLVTFNLNLMRKLIFLKKRYDVVIGLSVPPLMSIIVALFSNLRKVPFLYWIMDMWLDQAFEAKLINRHGMAGRILQRIYTSMLKEARLIIVLDRFMREKLEDIGINTEKIAVIPTWSVLDEEHDIVGDENPFRKEHSFGTKTVVMYSGNHSICHPLDTILEAAKMLECDERFLFVFIGAGTRVADVISFKEKHRLKNIIHLPYQPREQLHYSLTAADIHAVVMGEPYVGVVHPCKIYGIMASRRPFFLVGPKECHVSDLTQEAQYGYQVEHGDSCGLVDILRKIRDIGEDEKKLKGENMRNLIKNNYSRNILSNRIIDRLEEMCGVNRLM